MRKVAVSACLLGECCRYDGETKGVPGVAAAFADAQIIPFCPEAPVLGTPRERISVIRTAEGLRIIADESGRDVTALLEAQTRELIALHPDLEAIVLKSKSPSCGLGSTPILGPGRELLGFGNGVAAQMLRDAFPQAEISDETPFEPKGA